MGTKQIISKNISANSTEYIGKDGELWVDTDTNKMKISDGATAGGVDIVGLGGGGGATTWAGITDINNAAGPAKIVIGSNATAGTEAVSIGKNAGDSGDYSQAIGNNAGNTGQGVGAVALGSQSGETSQGDKAVAVGQYAGQTDQSTTGTAVGFQAGKTDQDTGAVAVGAQAGLTTQGAASVAIGQTAGSATQSINAVAIGSAAGHTTQGAEAVAIGLAAGNNTQGNSAIAIGRLAGTTSQGANTVAIGYTAGKTSQGDEAIAIGDDAGEVGQGTGAVAIGDEAGQTNQGIRSIAIGMQAGETTQADYAVAIGYEAGMSNQAANSIVINASGTTLDNTTASSLVIKPIRSAGGTTMLMYDATSGEVTHTATPLITGDLAVEENFSFTPTNKYFEVETGSGNNRIMRSGINMSTFGQSVAPNIDLTSYRASPADGDAGPELVFRASTAGSSNSVIANIETKVIATASGAQTTKVSIRTVNAGTSVTPFTITGDTVYSASHISIADLKILTAAAINFADFQNLIAAI